MTGWAIWVTGLPGSGKSAIARAAAEILAREGRPVRVLELDEMRRAVTPAPTYSDAERDVVYRALGAMAAALAEAGVRVLVDATAHRRLWRDLARAAIARFGEVQLQCPLEVCRQREQARQGGHAPRGIYARAGRPGARVPGVDVPYEPALHPELTIDTTVDDVATAARKVAALARRLEPVPPPAESVRPTAGWAIWITGLPGSGKTTLARSAGRALAAAGARVRVLEFATFRRAVAGEQPESEALQEILHRAFAYTAKLLTDAGVGVILDATAPRRAWRARGRALIPVFAEVQLVCPPEVCGSRERAARWGLGAREAGGSVPCAVAEAPEIVLDYEEPLGAELILHTHVQDVSTSTDAVVRLAQRVARAAERRP